MTAASIQSALNALPTIGGAASVRVAGFLLFEVTFARNLANTNVAQLVSAPGYPAIVMSTSMEGGVAVVNGTQGGAGIWRLQGGSWFNLTSVVSSFRSSLATTAALPPAQGANPTAGNGSTIPNSPGPDDDYRMEFPQINAKWSDVALVYTDISNNPNNGSVRGAPVIYAALGTTAGTGGINNAVFWTRNPTSTAPIWYVGDPAGSPYSNPPVAPTTSDARNANGFPKGQFAVPNPGGGNPSVPEVALNGNIKIAGVPIANTTGTELVTSNLYAAVSTPEGRLRSIYVTRNGGQSWAAVTTPSSLYSVGNFSNAILAVNANTVFIGGQGISAAGAQTILMTTDGGTTWVDVSVDSNLEGPHAGIHSFSLDSTGRLLVSTDGGVWRRETSGNWTNLNGDLAVSNINSVASDPTRTTSAVSGAQANGITMFDNKLPWTRVDGYGGGPVAIDPNNSQNMYAVSLQTGTNAVLRKSTDGGITWNTALAIGNPTAPLVLDSVNTSRLLVGGLRLNESNNGGATWTNLLVPIPVNDIAIANAQGVFAVDPAFLLVTDRGANAYDPDTIYVTDGSTVAHEESRSELGRRPPTSSASGPSPTSSSIRATATPFTSSSARFGGGHVFKTTNAGVSWTDITGDLPDVPTWKVVIDPRTEFLYVGTDRGVYHSTDGGASWSRFGVGLPNVQVKDIELNLTTNTLLAGTYGRSVYQLFLDTQQTSITPVTGAVTALGGSSVWTGNVVLDGDPVDNTVTFGAYGLQNLPNSIPVASLNFVGPISDFDSDGPAPTLTKVGQGDVIFSGSNIYGGETIVVEGALVVDNTHALGGNAGGTSVLDGAVLELRSSLDEEPIALNGNGLSFNDHFTGALRNVSGDNTYTGPLTLNHRCDHRCRQRLPVEYRQFTGPARIRSGHD